MRSNNLIFIGLFLILSLLLPAKGAAEEASAPAQPQWQTIESRFCTILSHPDVDIEKVVKKIKIRFYDLDCNPSSFRTGSEQDKLAKKVDCIFRKVEKILDMYPRKIHLTVRIFPGQAELDKTYRQIFGKSNYPRRISYYVHKYTTIYTTEQALSQGVLAHEMGHAVSDHYFLILPPERVKELLAQYVEMHLED